MMRRCAPLLLAVLAFAAPLAAQPNADTPAADEKLLQSAHLKTDPAALLDFFRKRMAEASDRELADLIRQLGDANGEAADRAIGDLVATGPQAIPHLKLALKNKAIPAALPRIQKSLDWLEGPARLAIPTATARLLALRKPAGAAQTLLDFAANAQADEIIGDIRDALAGLARADGKTEPALVNALADKHPHRRSVAAEALVQARVWEQVPAIRRLLEAKEPIVRLRVALALSEIRDPLAPPVLIALLGELPLGQCRQAEETLHELAGAFAPKVTLGADDAGRKKCRDAWAAWWKESDAPAIPDYFRRRTLTDVSKVSALIRDLGHASHPTRQKATTELIALRSLAVPWLKLALKSPDAEVQRRSRMCLDQIALAIEAPRTIVNVRLLLLRHPADAAEVLLDFLPFADDDSVEDEIRAALVLLARRDNLAHKSLLARFDDKFPQRRGPVAEALAATGSPEHRKLVRDRLQDAEPSVRLRAAVALAAQQDRAAIPVLIALLAELPLAQARVAEEVLIRLAEAQSPRVQLANDDAARQKCRKAWADWWAANADRAELTRLARTNRLLGYTVLARWDYSSRTNEVVELGLAGDVRWKIENLGYSFDFQLLPNNRILLAENNLNRVTERNFKGDILWEFKCISPHNCQRLPNGNTFIAANSELIEIDRNGTELYRLSFSNMSACKLTDGRILVVGSNSLCTWMDAKGKASKTVQIVPNVSSYGCLEALPRGGALLCLHGTGKVVEFDADSKVKWEIKLPSPFMAVRLPNGNTLVTSQSDKSAVEVDATGQTVWSHRPDMGIWRARRR